jgi:uncharacterized protein YegP (UPF0339 family)
MTLPTPWVVDELRAPDPVRFCPAARWPCWSGISPGAAVLHPLWRETGAGGAWEAAAVLPPGAGCRTDRGGNMAGKFVVKKGASGKYHFNLVAANGQVIATSEAYEHKQSARHGIESVKQNAPGAEVDDQTGE